MCFEGKVFIGYTLVLIYVSAAIIMCFVCELQQRSLVGILFFCFLGWLLLVRHKGIAKRG